LKNILLIHYIIKNMESLASNRNINIFICVVMVIVIFSWFFMPSTIEIPILSDVQLTEGYAQPEAVPEEALKEDGPFVDPRTGSLIDGPGYEKGDKETPYSDVWSGIPSNYYFLDDGASGAYSIQHNLCSKSCCSESWPTPFKQKHDPFVCANKDKFVSSRIMCNNTFQDSGCLCLTKDQAKFLANRGNNGSEWF